MTRLFNALAVLRSTIKTGSQIVTVSSNKHVERTLALLRENGIIAGYSYIQPKAHTYTTRFLVYLKFTDSNSPVLKNISLFKNTKSNFYYRQQPKTLQDHQFYLISCNQGLILTTRLALLKPSYLNKYAKVKILGEISL